MNRIICAVAVLVIAAGSPAFAQDSSSGTSTSQSKDAGSPQVFVNEAAVSNMFEIQSSKLALEKSDSQDVKDFAQRMIDDHTKAAEKLKQAATAEKISDMPSSLDDKHQQMMSKLNSLDGAEFTKQYIQMQVQAHQTAVALFKNYKDHSGKLGEFAAATLPTLQEHLDMVQKLAS